MIGTLALYDKVAPDRFFAGAFGDDDLHVFGRLVSYVERGIENALFHASRAARTRASTRRPGLPNAEYLARRVSQELARAGGAGRLGRARHLQARQPARAAPAPTRAARSCWCARGRSAAHRTCASSTCSRAPPRTSSSALLPDPGAAPEERVTALARAVAEEIAKDEALAGGPRANLAFGYAVHPAEGSDRDALLARARKPRIRMV